MLDALTPELQDRIFSYLPRQDIANVRLVSKQCEACSTPYLVTRIVISKRLDSLERAWEVLQHQIFPKYVREIVWDVSAYSRQIMFSFENYIEGCYFSTEKTFLDPISVDRDNRFVSLCSAIGLKCSALPWDKLGLAEMENYNDEHMYAAGVHRGYDDYFRCWMDQRRITKKRAHWHVLEMALCRCPRIRRIQVTDFTALRITGESYAGLCERLFGNTLEPLRLQGGLCFVVSLALDSQVVNTETSRVKDFLEKKGRDHILVVKSEGEEESEDLDVESEMEDESEESGSDE